MTAEEIEDRAHDIAFAIFYSPATNGKSAQSLKDGQKRIIDFLEEYAKSKLPTDEEIGEKANENNHLNDEETKYISGYKDGIKEGAKWIKQQIEKR